MFYSSNRVSLEKFVFVLQHYRASETSNSYVFSGDFFPIQDCSLAYFHSLKFYNWKVTYFTKLHICFAILELRRKRVKRLIRIFHGMLFHSMELICEFLLVERAAIHCKLCSFSRYQNRQSVETINSRFQIFYQNANVRRNSLRFSNQRNFKGQNGFL